MSCPICGRGACAYSFHSIDQQRLHDEVSELTKKNTPIQLANEVLNLRETIKDLKAEVEHLEDLERGSYD